MKTIIGVDDRPHHFMEVPQEAETAIPTYRNLFRSACGTGQAKNADESIDLFQLGIKLRAEGSDLQLEDYDFKLLKERCEKNPCQWWGHLQGQVLLKLKQAEK